MVKVGKKIAKHRIAILIIGFLLLIPSAFGYFNTRVNYDILYYLPDNIDTMKGQEILMDDFGKGAFAMEVVEGMTTKEVTDVKKTVLPMSSGTIRSLTCPFRLILFQTKSKTFFKKIIPH